MFGYYPSIESDILLPVLVPETNYSDPDHPPASYNPYITNKEGEQIRLKPCFKRPASPTELPTAKHRRVEKKVSWIENPEAEALKEAEAEIGIAKKHEEFAPVISEIENFFKILDLGDSLDYTAYSGIVLEALHKYYRNRFGAEKGKEFFRNDCCHLTAKPTENSSSNAAEARKFRHFILGKTIGVLYPKYGSFISSSIEEQITNHTPIKEALETIEKIIENTEKKVPHKISGRKVYLNVVTEIIMKGRFDNYIFSFVLDKKYTSIKDMVEAFLNSFDLAGFINNNLPHIEERCFHHMMGYYVNPRVKEIQKDIRDALSDLCNEDKAKQEIANKITKELLGKFSQALYQLETPSIEGNLTDPNKPQDLEDHVNARIKEMLSAEREKIQPDLIPSKKETSEFQSATAQQPGF
ncbi:MAG: hypothetical protein K0R12_982 [Gammaproteobacteria bacterium]|nr:hypothetical protein [Gammaproteobacteria bacterium]